MDNKDKGVGGVEGGRRGGVLAWVGGCIKVEIQGERSPGYICVCVCVPICSLSALRNLFLYTVSHSLVFCDFFKYPPLDWTNSLYMWIKCYHSSTAWCCYKTSSLQQHVCAKMCIQYVSVHINVFKCPFLIMLVFRFILFIAYFPIWSSMFLNHNLDHLLTHGFDEEN